MTDGDNSTLSAKVKSARLVVDRIVQICSGFESDEWMAKFIAVQNALAEGRLRDAVREESKLTGYAIPRKWVLSGFLEQLLERVMGVLHRQLTYPDRFEEGLVVEDLPTDVTRDGTDAEVDKRLQKAIARIFISDPLDTATNYETIMSEASMRAAAELELEGMVPALGYCHSFWRRKKEILRRDYGLEWKSPAELYPGIRFD